MSFTRISPSKQLADVVECYWIVKNEDSTPEIQKIIPDGFTEMIFHFGDPYQIKLKDKWELQPKDLLAGQITRFFHLQNTGVSDMLGVKFKPAALTRLFDIAMHDLTDRVVELNEYLGEKSMLWRTSVSKPSNDADRITILEESLMKMIPKNPMELPIEKVVQHIFNSKGSVTVADLCSAIGVQERQLERLFKRYIGVSPKFFARIIRFSTIFELVKEREISGSELGLESGFYDQSHFIRNFKAFTGEDPSKYFFDQPNLANFFLKK